MNDSSKRNSANRFRISPEAVANRMGDQVVLVHVGTDRIFELNPTAARIWDLLSQGHDRQEIQQLLLQEFHVAEDSAAEQVDQLLTSLLAENIITVDNE